MKLIDDWRKSYKLFSVQTLIAIVVISIADAALSFFHPESLTARVTLGALSGLLGVAGIVLRNVKQRPIDAASADPARPTK